MHVELTADELSVNHQLREALEIAIKELNLESIIWDNIYKNFPMGELFERTYDLSDYEPFTAKDIPHLKNKWVLYKPDPTSISQLTFFKTLESGEFIIAGFTAEMLLEYCTFEDGSPCGNRKIHKN